ncbi:hypothetical protein B0H16DRAFT_585321 [Mycena metata]|uniref:Uncharacterized protein n=1 Tax=Mycena metata TaxID=1033252 RepID=A0AAD7JCR8_9AGAR|nr:hypothetical protein B0H16DRAFT_585321 [Mycena metata]
MIFDSTPFRTRSMPRATCGAQHLPHISPIAPRSTVYAAAVTPTPTLTSRVQMQMSVPVPQAHYRGVPHPWLRFRSSRSAFSLLPPRLGLAFLGLRTKQRVFRPGKDDGYAAAASGWRGHRLNVCGYQRSLGGNYDSVAAPAPTRTNSNEYEVRSRRAAGVPVLRQAGAHTVPHDPTSRGQPYPLRPWYAAQDTDLTRPRMSTPRCYCAYFRVKNGVQSSPFPSRAPTPPLPTAPLPTLPRPASARVDRPSTHTSTRRR